MCTGDRSETDLISVICSVSAGILANWPTMAPESSWRATLFPWLAACNDVAFAAGAVTNAYYRRFFDTALTISLITPGIVLFSVALSLALGVAAGALAAWRLVRTRPRVLWGRG